MDLLRVSSEVGRASWRHHQGNGRRRPTRTRDFSSRIKEGPGLARQSRLPHCRPRAVLAPWEPGRRSTRMAKAGLHPLPAGRRSACSTPSRPVRTRACGAVSPKTSAAPSSAAPPAPAARADPADLGAGADRGTVGISMVASVPTRRRAESIVPLSSPWMSVRTIWVPKPPTCPSGGPTPVSRLDPQTLLGALGDDLDLPLLNSRRGDEAPVSARARGGVLARQRAERAGLRGARARVFGDAVVEVDVLRPPTGCSARRRSPRRGASRE